MTPIRLVLLKVLRLASHPFIRMHKVGYRFDILTEKTTGAFLASVVSDPVLVLQAIADYGPTLATVSLHFSKSCSTNCVTKTDNADCASSSSPI